MDIRCSTNNKVKNNFKEIPRIVQALYNNTRNFTKFTTVYPSVSKSSTLEISFMNDRWCTPQTTI